MEKFLVLVCLAVMTVACAQMPKEQATSVEATPPAPAQAAEVKPVAPADPPVAQVQAAPVVPAAPAVVAQTKEKPEVKEGFAFGGQLFLALQNWSRVGDKSDSKMGMGIGGSLGIGYQFDDMKFLIGPQFWYNSWEADYSQKSQSATDSVYVKMSDVGMALMTYFDEFFLEIGAGKSTISSAMVVNGQEIAYSYDGDQFNYTSVSLGMKYELFMFGIGMKNYDGLAKYADHFNFMIGLGF